MSEINKQLSWNQRFALIEKYNPNDETICQVFGVNNDELKTARGLLSDNTFKPEANGLDLDEYSEYFGTISNPRSTKNITSSTAPRSATKPIKVPKKRGKKGDKIVKAFEAIPKNPVNVEDFATTHDVSVPVLRQSKRFDKSGLDGRVRVKKDKETGNLMIWRESE